MTTSLSKNGIAPVIGYQFKWIRCRNKDVSFYIDRIHESCIETKEGVIYPLNEIKIDISLIRNSTIDKITNG